MFTSEWRFSFVPLFFFFFFSPFIIYFFSFSFCSPF